MEAPTEYDFYGCEQKGINNPDCNWELINSVTLHLLEGLLENVK